MDHVPLELPWYLDFWIIIIVSAAFLTFCIMSGFNKLENKGKDSPEKKVTFLFPMIISAIILATQITMLQVANDKWKEEHGEPYIESLPVEKSEIINELEVKSSEKVKVIFNVNGELITYKPPSIHDNFKAFKEMKMKFTLQSGQSPYIEYSYLEKPIELIDSGYYNLVLYLPEDYHF